MEQEKMDARSGTLPDNHVPVSAPRSQRDRVTERQKPEVHARNLRALGERTIPSHVRSGYQDRNNDIHHRVVHGAKINNPIYKYNALMRLKNGSGEKDFYRRAAFNYA